MAPPPRRRPRGAPPGPLLALLPLLLPGPARGAPEGTTSCVWPNCTSHCEPCKPVPFTTCLLYPLSTCGEHAECQHRLCQCEAGYCRRKSGCVPADCSLGAQPEPFEPGAWSKALASLGPDVPRGGQAQEWKYFAFKSALLPALLLALGLFVAVCTFLYVTTDHDHSACDILPSSPWLLLGLAGGLLAVVILGILMRHIAMLAIFNVAEDQMEHLDSNLGTVKNLAEVLNATVNNFSDVFHELPRSCALSVARAGMEKLVLMGDEYVVQVSDSVTSVLEMVGELEGKIDMAEDLTLTVQTFLQVVPVLPLVLMFLVTGAVIVVTLISWCHHDPVIADKADDRFFEHGGWCISGLIISTALLAALYLWTGISEGALCSNVDENIMAIVNDINFTNLTNSSSDIDPLVKKAFAHYIFGEGSNPLVAKLDNIREMLLNLHELWNNTQEAIDLAGDVCKAMDKFNVHKTVAQVLHAVATMTGLLVAENVWPYYSDIFHQLVCGSFLDSMGILLVISVLVGLIFFPVLSVVAHVDLDRWSDWKLKNGHGGSRALRRGKGSDQPDASSSTEDEAEPLTDPPKPAKPLGTAHSREALLQPERPPPPPSGPTWHPSLAAYPAPVGPPAYHYGGAGPPGTMASPASFQHAAAPAFMPAAPPGAPPYFAPGPPAGDFGVASPVHLAPPVVLPAPTPTAQHSGSFPATAVTPGSVSPELLGWDDPYAFPEPKASWLASRAAARGSDSPTSAYEHT